MSPVALVDPRILPVPRNCFVWGVGYHYNCDNIVVNPFLYLEVFSVDTMESVEAVSRYVCYLF